MATYPHLPALSDVSLELNRARIHFITLLHQAHQAEIPHINLTRLRRRAVSRHCTAPSPVAPIIFSSFFWPRRLKWPFPCVPGRLCSLVPWDRRRASPGNIATGAILEAEEAERGRGTVTYYLPFTEAEGQSQSCSARRLLILSLFISWTIQGR